MTPYHRAQVLMAIAAIGLVLFLLSPLIRIWWLTVLAWMMAGGGYAGAVLTTFCHNCGASLFATDADWPPREAADFVRARFRLWPKSECSSCGAMQDG